MCKNVFKGFAIFFLLLLVINVSAQDKKNNKLKSVVFKTELECENCKKNIEKDIPFRKGVKDLSVDLKTKEVTIKYDSLKTDSVTLRKALNKVVKVK